MFGLSDKAATRTASRGRSKGVVLVRSPRRVSWLSGWTPAPGAAAPADGGATKPAATSGPPAPARRQT